jgi:hypothetical protein
VGAKLCRLLSLLQLSLSLSLTRPHLLLLPLLLRLLWRRWTMADRRTLTRKQLRRRH